MQELYDLKDMLCKELKEYGTKGELTAGSLDVVDKLTHAMKNLDKVIEAYEEEGEYSSASYPDGMGGSNRGYSREGNRGGSYRGSYARGRMNARRDSMGRYSGDDGMHDIEAVKAEARRLVEKIDRM